MKNPNTGLYNFGKSLGNALFDILEKYSDVGLTFYLPKKGSELFEGKLSTIRHNEFYKYYFPQKARFELVHFTDQICRLKPSKVSGKKILTIHDLNFLYEKEALSEEDKTTYNRLKGNIKICDRIVAISNFVAKDLLEHFPEASDKIHVIYNGADRLKPTVGHQPAYYPTKSFIFSIGEVLPKKNFHVLPALLNENDYELVIAGNLNAGKYASVIKKEARSLGVGDRVKIIGPVSEEDKAWYYENCLAFVFPSIAEGFGLPIIEAMHFGKPVFLSTRTAVPEIGGEEAFYFLDFEPKSMQKVFREGLEVYNANPGKRAALVRRAEVFSWEETAEQYFDLYKNVLGLS